MSVVLPALNNDHKRIEMKSSAEGEGILEKVKSRKWRICWNCKIKHHNGMMKLSPDFIVVMQFGRVSDDVSQWIMVTLCVPCKPLL
ncbi:hypothetical protein CEXT_521251 [Caerostris extrusa]|uniref:Uncharacterized protein n=1 Tax=Caerostris extrusa TaxID=172846 RepID=A0AAV4NHZ7_CAEEX|nr:hypothetical protein CEXT_521251 [Caerostris extrusa]